VLKARKSGGKPGESWAICKWNLWIFSHLFFLETGVQASAHLRHAKWTIKCSQSSCFEALFRRNPPFCTAPELISTWLAGFDHISAPFPWTPKPPELPNSKTPTSKSRNKAEEPGAGFIKSDSYLPFPKGTRKWSLSAGKYFEIMFRLRCNFPRYKQSLFQSLLRTLANWNGKVWMQASTWVIKNRLKM